LGLPFASRTLDCLVAYLGEKGIGMKRSRAGEVLRALELKWHQEETWPEIEQAVQHATAYWNAHKHPFLWGRTRQHRTPRRPGSPLFRMRQPFSAECLLSVGDLSDRAQFIRACRPEAEEFQIGWYLLEQHVCSDQITAAVPCRSFEQR